MTWFLLSITSVITLAIANLFQRILMKDETGNAVAYSFVFQFMCASLIGLFAFAQGFIMPPIRELWLNFGLMTILYASGTILLFKALQTTEASRATILRSSAALWTITVALTFLGESFNFFKFIGIGLILGGVLLVSFKKEEIKFTRGDLFALGSAFCYGVAFANDTFILRQADALSYTTIAFLLPGLLILAMKPGAIKDAKLFLKPSILLRMAILVILYSASAIMVYLAYQQGGAASQLAAIAQSGVILTVMLAAIFLRERSHLPRKFIAAVIATAGVLLIR